MSNTSQRQDSIESHKLWIQCHSLFRDMPPHSAKLQRCVKLQRIWCLLKQMKAAQRLKSAAADYTELNTRGF